MKTSLYALHSYEVERMANARIAKWEAKQAELKAKFEKRVADWKRPGLLQRIKNWPFYAHLNRTPEWDDGDDRGFFWIERDLWEDCADAIAYAKRIIHRSNAVSDGLCYLDSEDLRIIQG